MVGVLKYSNLIGVHNDCYLLLFIDWLESLLFVSSRPFSGSLGACVERGLPVGPVPLPDLHLHHADTHLLLQRCGKEYNSEGNSPSVGVGLEACPR